MKKIYYIVLFFLFLKLNIVFAAPPIHCDWLPWCKASWNNWSIIEKVSSNIITDFIQYIAVFAVTSLMISWIMYMLSGWEEEKTKRAKTWIIWSLVGVFLSISSYYIISSIANININL